MINQRSITIFSHAISSEATKKSYFYQLKRFKEFYKIRDYDSLITIEPKKLQVMIEDYIMNRSTNLERGSLRHSLSALELFFSMNDVVLNWKKSPKLIPKQRTSSKVRKF